MVKPKVNMPADLVSYCFLDNGWSTSCCVLMWRKEFSGIAFIRAVIPTTSQRPPWQGASHWGLGFNMWILGEHNWRFVQSICIHIEKAHIVSISLGKISQTECSLKPTSESRNRTLPGIACFQDDGHQFLPSMHKKKGGREGGLGIN